MPYLEIFGVNHYYEWIGQPEAPLQEKKPNSDKPTMVFIHGWAGSDRYWESTAFSLVEQFDCLLFDMRGFGRSPFPRPLPQSVAKRGYELDTYADDLAALLDKLGLQKVYLNAHSTGSSVAVLFLNRYADRVERAILTCSGVFEYNELAFKSFHKVGGYVVKFRPGWFRKIPWLDLMFMQRFLRRSIPRYASRAFLEDFLTADAEAAEGTIYTAVSKRAAEEMPDEFAQIKVPTLLVSGEYDQIIPPELGRAAAQLNPCIQHIVLPETAHFPMMEDPTAYLQNVKGFLQI